MLFNAILPVGQYEQEWCAEEVIGGLQPVPKAGVLQISGGAEREVIGDQPTQCIDQPKKMMPQKGHQRYGNQPATSKNRTQPAKQGSHVRNPKQIFRCSSVKCAAAKKQKMADHAPSQQRESPPGHFARHLAYFIRRYFWIFIRQSPSQPPGDCSTNRSELKGRSGQFNIIFLYRQAFFYSVLPSGAQALWSKGAR